MTIKDIAKLARVSPSTVSKIINGKADNIRPETKAHVLDIVRQYHYSPSNYIRQASTSRSYKIGVLLNRSFHNSVFLHSLVSSTEKMGYYPVVCCSDGDPDVEKKFLSFLEADGVDGLLWERVDSDTPAADFMQKKRKLPYLLINEEAAPPETRIPYYDYGYYAAETLISNGHHRIAFFAEEKRYESDLLFKGFRSCMSANTFFVTKSDWALLSESSAVDLLKEGYTAAICVGKSIAVSLSRQLSRLNCVIPQDFSVLILSDTEEIGDFRFSSIVIPYKKYGAFLASRMVRSIEKDNKLPEFASPLTSNPDVHTIAAPRNYLSKHILVIGSIHMDIDINSDYLPLLGRVIPAKAMNTFPGGKGTNQAIGLAKLNKTVYLIGRIGSDFDGITIKDTLSKYRVRTEGLISDEHNTGRAFIYILNNGESAITIYNGANLYLTVSDIRRSQYLFSNANYCLLQTEIPIAVVEYSAKMAKRHKVKVVLKPSSITQISDELLSAVDYFIPNEGEIDTLFPNFKSHEEQCQYLLEKGVGTVILTLGKSGCYLHSKEERRYFPASNHIAVDTTGGSDAFIAAFVACLSENADLHEAIYYANCAAGFCVSQLGVFPSLIDSAALKLYHYKDSSQG